MESRTIAFLLGILLLQQFSQLLDERWVLPILLVVLLLRLFTGTRISARLYKRAFSHASPCPTNYIPAKAVVSAIAWFAIGFLWAWFRASLLLSNGLPVEFEGQDILVEGIVSELPQVDERGIRFVFEVEKALPRTLHKSLDKNMPVLELGRIRLSWYGRQQTIIPGERWRFMVRLKRPWGMMNPGSFDYEAWLFQRGIRATGYVRSSKGTNTENNIRLADSPWSYPVQKLRDSLRGRLAQTLEDNPFRGIITALALGDRQAMTARQWEVFIATGTNHLMAISGLHIGLVAALAYLVMRWLWVFAGSFALTVPAPKAGAFAALLAAVVYAALAGFSIPTQRALVMIAVAMGAVLLQRHVLPRQGLALALLLVLLLDPLAVLAPGFWLSFAAVAVILYGMSGRLSPRGLWWRWGRVQWLVAIGLLPFMLLLFGRVAPLSPLANIIAVPWMGFLVVPLTLLGTLLLPLAEPLASLLLNSATWLVECLWPLLEGLADASPGLQFPAPPLWTVLPGLVGMAWLLAPRGWPVRGLGIIGLLPMLLNNPVKPDVGEIWLTLLDVGQGLATVVQTTNHVLVYDTGPRFSASFDTGKAVVAPYLQHKGLGRIDTLVISHGDNDHIGGAQSLSRALPVEEILTSVSGKVHWQQSTPCQRGQQWRWDGVDFEVLHPPSHYRQRGNDGSCVIRVSNQAGDLLLTGDIEALSELELIVQEGDALQARVLIAPHHGSKTSSTESFIAAVAPEYVLIPVGYRNRYNLPNATVVSRYQNVASTLLDTASHGAISMVLANGQELSPSGYRSFARRYWHSE